MSTPAKEKGRILGIGGVFFQSPDKQKLTDWYEKNLGLEGGSNEGVRFLWRLDEDPSKELCTTWAIFPKGTKYFEPSNSPFMINYIVDDLDAFLEKMKASDVKIDPHQEQYDFGRFAWIYDPDGNKLEIWQPTQA